MRHQPAAAGCLPTSGGSKTHGNARVAIKEVSDLAEFFQPRRSPVRDNDDDITIG
ncbi:hypothetical protein RP20_CCG000657 [Aedes albopictus]|nr:hypothetical protein RP20_CCG000657 [Aedes albopictus]